MPSPSMDDGRFDDDELSPLNSSRRWAGVFCHRSFADGRRRCIDERGGGGDRMMAKEKKDRRDDDPRLVRAAVRPLPRVRHMATKTTMMAIMMMMMMMIAKIRHAAMHG